MLTEVGKIPSSLKPENHTWGHWRIVNLLHNVTRLSGYYFILLNSSVLCRDWIGSTFHLGNGSSVIFLHYVTSVPTGTIVVLASGVFVYWSKWRQIPSSLKPEHQTWGHGLSVNSLAYDTCLPSAPIVFLASGGFCCWLMCRQIPYRQKYRHGDMGVVLTLYTMLIAYRLRLFYYYLWCALLLTEVHADSVFTKTRKLDMATWA